LWTTAVAGLRMEPFPPGPQRGGQRCRSSHLLPT
jgi:hypothetical protein